jgi:hypothetical protein
LHERCVLIINIIILDFNCWDPNLFQIDSGREECGQEDKVCEVNTVYSKIPDTI